MSIKRDVYIGTDSGATTSKTGGVWADGSIISTHLSQSSTRAEKGTESVIAGWVDGVLEFLKENGIEWDQVKGVGLALPGPYQSYGVLDYTPNLPDHFTGWNFLKDYSDALKIAAGRDIPLVVGNDGDFGGVGEAAMLRGDGDSSVLLLAPGSGLGAAYINSKGIPLSGDNFAGMEGGHMPVPLHHLGEGLDKVKPFSCGCGRTWGCIEAYSSISGLTQYLDYFLPQFPDHPFHTSKETMKKNAFALRALAQEGDELALKIFDTQAKALGIHIANMSMALDPGIVVIAGGLIDPHSTTEEFRNRYLQGIKDAAMPFLYPMQRKRIRFCIATLGELSQSIGAALMALYSDQQSG